MKIKILFLMGFFSFFSFHKQRAQSINKPTAYKALEAAIKEKLREEIKRDPKKDFSPEWKRTTQLERQIISTYGFEAIKLIFEDRNSENYFLLGDFPENCPWYMLNDKAIPHFIELNFKKIKYKIPRLLAEMKNRCEFIYAEKRKNDWYLHYLMSMKLHDGIDYYQIYSGGAPLLSFEPNPQLQRFNWKIPRDLREFYAIHDGFGPLYDQYYIFPSKDLRVMGEMMNPIAEEHGAIPEDYTFNDLLEFFPDGAGNAQCFFRHQKGKLLTVDWDHETWEISGAMSFYEFINQQMSQIDEE